MNNQMSEKDVALLSRLSDAFDDISAALRMFQRMINQPVNELCTAFFDTALSATEGTSIVEVPKSTVQAFNPEPENPDSGAQMIHLPEGMEMTQDNVVKSGVAMTRVMSPKVCFKVEDLAGVLTPGGRVSDLRDQLYATVFNLVASLRSTGDAATQECIVTRISGNVSLDPEDPGTHCFFVYMMYGVRPRGAA